MAETTAAGAALDLDRMLCFAIYSANGAFNRAYRPLLDKLGLTYPQYLVLLTLREHGDQTVGEIGARIFLESNTLTPLLKRLEAAGHLVRRRDTADERQVRVALTDQGRSLLGDACAVTKSLGSGLGITQTQALELRDSIAALRDALTAQGRADAGRDG
ncbi:MarR family transcriptional regulator [Kaistia sp. 32K]|uniref:MarR family winged helix-turn-helix transcriptional regulator n=1 Tax=Kaistia sp. 32K TaxID=2795690 RepID=UPI0019163AF7|nr:MarR family transcriptional regulator [Kaistia sp. 32K]BCP53057.1 MarR family transcriptional regulator [Kaistia sp. 32K]